MSRDPGYYWLRLAIYVALGIGLGYIYLEIGRTYSSIQARCSVIMFVATFFTFMAIGGFPSFVEDMKVFHKENLNGHYGCTAFVIGNTFSSLPFLLLVSLIPSAIAYFPIGLQRGLFDHFSYFFLSLFASMLVVESLMMIVSSVVPNYLMGIIAGAGIQALMILGGGYFRLPEDLPKLFWKYPLYYVSFHRFAYQGLFKNEFEGLRFAGMRDGDVIAGDEVLRDELQVEMGHSKWVDLLVLVGMVGLYRLLFLLVVKASEKAKPAMKALMRVSVGPDNLNKISFSG